MTVLYRSLTGYLLHWLPWKRWGEDAKRPCFLWKPGGSPAHFSHHSWEVEIASHPCISGWTATLPFAPRFFLSAANSFFVSYISCVKSTKLFLSENGNEALNSFQNTVCAVMSYWPNHYAYIVLLFQLFKFNLLLHIKIISQNIPVLSQ